MCCSTIAAYGIHNTESILHGYSQLDRKSIEAHPLLTFDNVNSDSQPPRRGSFRTASNGTIRTSYTVRRLRGKQCSPNRAGSTGKTVYRTLSGSGDVGEQTRASLPSANTLCSRKGAFEERKTGLQAIEVLGAVDPEHVRPGYPITCAAHLDRSRILDMLSKKVSEPLL